ncbi:MAG TPA: hypothetical protein VFH14_08120 [Gemmatimonadaceae bacterium]|jgi:hypothetical protein|nr:hypothetical protein [Gemmatimonadaceae bacterium]
MGKNGLRSPGPGISRIDQDSTRTHGYFVRVGYRLTDKGWRPKFSAFFGDASHKGAAGALRAAKAWHKEMSGSAGKSKRNGRSKPKAKSSRKKTTARRRTARR